MDISTTSSEIYFKDPSGTEIYLVPATAVQEQLQAGAEDSQIVGVPKSDVIDEDPGVWSFESVTSHVRPYPVESYRAFIIPEDSPPMDNTDNSS